MSLRMHNYGGGVRSHFPPAMLTAGIHQESVTARAARTGAGAERFL